MESVFETKEQYLEMRANWKKWFNEGKCLQAYQFALYALLRKKDWRKGFSVNSRPETIENIEYLLLKGKYLDLSPFGDTITTEHISKLREFDIPKWERS